MRTLTRVGGLWQGRDFRLFWSGETISKFGSAITTLAMPLVAVSVLDASAFVVGIVTAAAWLPWLVIGLPAGAWTDRLPRRPLMITCNLVSVVALASVPVAAWMDVLTTVHLVVAALLAGTAAVFFTTAYQVFLPSIVPADDLAEGNAKLQGSESAAMIAGPGVGGLLMQIFGPAMGLVVDTGTFIVSTLCLLGMERREAARPAPQRREPLLHQIGEGLSFVARDPYLRVFTVYAAVANLAFTGFQALTVVFLVQTVGVSAGTVGVLVALTGLGGILGAAITTRVGQRWGTARALLLAALCTTPFGFLVPLTMPGPGLAFFLLGSLILEGGAMVGNILAISFRQRYCPAHLLGRVTASMRFVSYGALPLGALLAGGLATWLGVRGALWVVFAIYMASGFTLLPSPVRRQRDLPSPSPQVTARQ